MERYYRIKGKDELIHPSELEEVVMTEDGEVFTDFDSAVIWEENVYPLLENVDIGNCCTNPDFFTRLFERFNRIEPFNAKISFLYEEEEREVTTSYFRGTLEKIIDKIGEIMDSNDYDKFRIEDICIESL